MKYIKMLLKILDTAEKEGELLSSKLTGGEVDCNKNPGDRLLSGALYFMRASKTGFEGIGYSIVHHVCTLPVVVSL